MTEKRPYWNPYLGGFVLGLVLLASFVVTGRGLGASGSFRRVAAAAIHATAPAYAEANPGIARFFADGTRSLLDDWIVWLAFGIAVGGAIAVFTARRFAVQTVMGPRADRRRRWVLAVAGGAISGVASQIARGCTSGQGLTGAAQLALGSWAFLLAVFAGAYGLAWFVRRQWV